MAVTFNPMAASHPLVAVLATLVALVDIALLSALGYYAARRLGYSSAWVEGKLKPFLRHYYRELTLLIASTATLGSLYMSNFLGWTPCKMCWYQRILIYPIVVVSAAGLITEDDSVRNYVIPLALIGLPIAFYHSLMQRIEQFSSAGCSVVSVSCSTKYTFFYGYITVPVMATTALLAVLVLMWKFSGSD